MRLLSVIFIAGLIWLVGLFAFAHRVRELTPADDPARADAIVALTGPSSERVNTAIRLLEQGKGERVLISGVNREVRRQELRELTPGSSRLFNCCVDIDYAALDTEGNALESAKWLKDHAYRSAIVVTNNYHMPRTLLEMKRIVGSTTFVPYPVVNTRLDGGNWLS